jgi:hexosaminidase
MVPALRLLLAFLAVGSCIAADHIDLWPMPKSVNHGTQRLYVSKDLAMSMEGSKYSDEKAILKDAFQRTVDLLKLNHAADGANPSSYVLTGVNIAVQSPEDEVTCSFDLMNCRVYLRIARSDSVDALFFIFCSSTLV